VQIDPALQQPPPEADAHAIWPAWQPFGVMPTSVLVGAMVVAQAVEPRQAKPRAQQFPPVEAPEAPGHWCWWAASQGRWQQAAAVEVVGGWLVVPIMEGEAVEVTRQKY
jgi:hypothetical protein